MMAINHALTGALIGLSLDQPALALSLAFVSHFALDAVPHYDPPGDPLNRMRSKRFLWEQLIINGVLCVALVVVLAATHPGHWLQAAISAFLAASPDLLWLPKFVMAKRQNKLRANDNWFYKMHHALQWCTGTWGLWIELPWLALTGWLVMRQL